MPGRLQNKARNAFSLNASNVDDLFLQAALITGGGSGIGLESSILFAQEGANVLLVDVNLKAAEAGAALINQRYPNVKAIAIKADVGKEEDVKNAVDTAVKEFGRLDVMFNNAGIMHPEDDNALNTEERIWDLTMQINLKGVWWGCKYAILAMRNNPTDESKGLHAGGSIINTASFVAIMGAATPQLAYTASKGGVLAMTRELAMVHAREGIRINSLCPGPLKTPLLMDFLNTEEKRQRRLVHLPMGRFGEAVELAKAALFHNVVFLTIADKSYPRKLAFSYLDELSKEFSTTYGPKVESVRKPYAFVGFDTFMSKTARLYRDTRTAAATSSLDKLNDDLQDVTRIMTKNMEELLWRGDSLDRMSHLSTSLKSESEKYRKAAKNINFNAMLRQFFDIFCIIWVKGCEESKFSAHISSFSEPNHATSARDYQQTYLPLQPPPSAPIPADGSLAYVQYTGDQGQPQYRVFKAVRASYTISNNVVNGMQWVPVETIDTLPAGARPASPEFLAFMNRDRGWQRQSEAEAKRKQDLDKSLQTARALDAQTRERRRSVNASSFPSDVSTSGSVGPGAQYGTQYPPRSPHGVYNTSSTSNIFSDLDRQMGNIDLRDRSKEYPNEKAGEISTHAPRPQKYTATEVSDRPRSPHPVVRSASRAEGPYGAATASGAYNTAGRPYSTAGYQPSTSPNPRPAEVPFIPGNSPYRAPDPLPRSTTPSMVYPPGHIMEGQPILPQDRARMTPIPRGRSPAPPLPYNSNAVGLSQSASSPNMSISAPHAGSHGAPPKQLAAPEGFSRPINGSRPFPPFQIMKIQDMEKFWSELPKMPAVLMYHDVFEEDWRRLMVDMALAWAEKLPIPEPEEGGGMPKRSTIVADLVNLWNESFFMKRDIELVLFRGKERRTGPLTGFIDENLPYLEEPDDYISSEEDTVDDDSNSDLEYGGGRYQHPGYGDPQRQMAEIFEEGRRRKEAKIAREAERKRRRQERHRKRRERIRARKYALYLTYVRTSVAGGGYGGGSVYPSGSQYGGRY
ncbi:hypothetical protein C0993_002438 [Termitomyces sp. T159_Od127]|nr:hypothetical protein C0993_002438 [Termitomyces sp. T159_Od127]